MDFIRYRKIHILFHRALCFSGSKRLSFLKKACKKDQELLKYVLDLLEADSEDKTLFQKDIKQIAYEVFETSVLYPNYIGSYRIIKKLGKGGMGTVYLGKHKNLKRIVAIKVLQDPHLSSIRKEQFQREIKILAKLNHPNIARLYEADMLSDGTPYFTMEYLDGISISEYCTHYIDSDIKQILDLFLSVCEAVNYTHRKAIIHGDLKPSNIIVNRNGNIKLLDFGSAKQIDLLNQQKFDKKPGFQFLTLAYAAPERILQGESGVHTDVYSLGILLYQLLCGSLPYKNKMMSPEMLEKYIQEHKPPKISKVLLDSNFVQALPNGAGSWADLDTLCMGAIYKDPLRRYRSVVSFMRDIRNFLKHKPLEALSDTLPIKQKKNSSETSN